MPRNRVITPSEALFTSTNATGAQTISQLQRIQSANYNVAVRRTPVTQYGQLAPIDQVILDVPDVGLDFSYLVVDAYNESKMGFTVDGLSSAISGMLTKTTDEKNYYVLTAPEGNDAVGGDSPAGNNNVFGIGNGFISNYTFEARVGGFPTASVQVQASNMVIYSNSTGQQTPAIDPTLGTRITGINFSLPSSVSGIAGAPTALRPGDVVLTLANPLLGVAVSDAKVQDCRVTVDMSREPLNKLGSHFPFSKEIQYPINISIDVNANVGDLVTGDISAILCNDSNYNLTVGVREPTCPIGGGDIMIQYSVLGAKLESQNFSSSVGQSKTVALRWTAQVGGPTDSVHNLLISGVTSH